VGHFRQIFSIVTRNGRGPPRFRDAQDVMFVSFIKKYREAIMRTSVKRNPAPQQPEPQEPKSPPVPLESLEDIASPDLGGSDRGRTKSGHGALKGFLILYSVPRSTRSGPNLFVWAARDWKRQGFA
jgi:hypothetical protein